MYGRVPITPTHFVLVGEKEAGLGGQALPGTTHHRGEPSLQVEELSSRYRYLSARLVTWVAAHATTSGLPSPVCFWLLLAKTMFLPTEPSFYGQWSGVLCISGRHIQWLVFRIR